MSNEPRITFFGDIVEKNGKTIRENNLALKHNIPLGTKLRIPHPVPGDENGDDEGIEVFMPGIVGVVECYVVRHNRDCNGEPLYVMSPYKRFKYGGDELLWEWMDRSDLRSPITRSMVAAHTLSGNFSEEFVKQFIVEEDTDVTPAP